jgi:hypothetical protein
MGKVKQISTEVKEFVGKIQSELAAEKEKARNTIMAEEAAIRGKINAALARLKIIIKEDDEKVNIDKAIDKLKEEL